MLPAAGSNPNTPTHTQQRSDANALTNERSRQVAGFRVSLVASFPLLGVGRGKKAVGYLIWPQLRHVCQFVSRRRTVL